MAPAMPHTSRVSSSKVHMSAVVDEVMDKLKSMTLLEASELVKAIEETFDVDASAGGGGGMMMMAPGAAPAGGADAAAAEEKTEFDFSLESFPADKKIAVLKVVRTITGLGLKEAKELVESAPKVIKEGISKSEAEEFKKQVEEAGGVAELK
jgi:large subunit ribosomal protein L7/L12